MKFGGIGAVLDGLLGSMAYNARVARTILVGPFDSRNTAQMRRLNSSDNRLEVVYSSPGLSLGTTVAAGEAAPDLIAAFTRVEDDFGVRLLYGRRTFGSSKHEVLLLDGSTVNVDSANRFKGRLYEAFGLQSDRYEHDSEFRYYINAAEPSWFALQALVGDEAYTRRYVVAHEFMGLPLVFADSIHREGESHSLFYAHEVATARSLLERNLGY